jgi:hypothetical protein
MSCNFYTTDGIVTGMDHHRYWTVGPGGAPLEARAGYAVIASYQLNPASDGATKLEAVTAGGERMIQGKCNLEYVLHTPIFAPGPPHPAFEPIEVLLMIAFSSTVPLLRRQCVTGQGQPLAICAVSAFGVNIDCAEPCKMPTALAVSVVSVKTQASLADALPAAAEWAFETAFKPLFKTVGEKALKKLLERFRQKFLEQVLQKWIEGKIKEKTKDVLTWAKDKVAPRRLLNDLGVPFV